MQEKHTYSTSRLRDYALWYYFRYYPSNAKLLQKLNEKGRSEDVKEAFSSIEHLLQEDEILKTKINTYLLRNKNFSYIKSQLLRHKFPAEKIEQYLTPLREKWESLLSEDFLKRKIELLFSKGKSRYFILQQLSENKEDREKIEWIFEKFFPENEKIALKISYQKLKTKYAKEKIIQKLMMQGFRYDDIKRVLA